MPSEIPQEIIERVAVNLPRLYPITTATIKDILHASGYPEENAQLRRRNELLMATNDPILLHLYECGHLWRKDESGKEPETCPVCAMEKRIANLEAERAYLLRRSMEAGSVSFNDREREVGISSNAMVSYAFGGHEPTTYEYPRDAQDLATCYRARDRAPQHLQARMDEMLAKYENAVSQTYPKAVQQAKDVSRKKKGDNAGE